MNRRDFLLTALASGLHLSRAAPAEPPADTLPPDLVPLARALLRSMVAPRQWVADFLNPQPDAEVLRRTLGWTYDSELGWRLRDAVRADGINSSKTFYHYEADGARRVVNSAGQPSRLHTYGNSFTHGDQVSDGETWQEQLAAHFQEPVRNYGVGGYSVYQAYRRLRRVEQSGGAEYLILNIYDDDHFRNLTPWRALSSGRLGLIPGTLPFLRVHVAKGRCEPIDNLSPKPEDLYRLCDEDFVWRTFREEPVMLLALRAKADNEVLARQLVEAVAARFGVPTGPFAGRPAAEQLVKIYTAAALFATKQVVSWTEQFASQRDKKLLLLLTFGRANLQAELEGRPRFDQEFVDWLKNKPYPVVDVRDAFRADFQQSNGDVATYLRRHYVSPRGGHHSPAGNCFVASALRDPLRKWLRPAPLPYR